MASLREQLELLVELAERATPRPWGVRREDFNCGAFDYQLHDGGGGHLAVCPELASDKARPDALYIAASANCALPLARVVLAALDWCDDDGTCHFCALGQQVAPPPGRGWLGEPLPTQESHDDDCPLAEAARAMGVEL
jgi:hypothetical protein